MNFALLLPGALLALAALALPLLIHLHRRSEKRLTDFAALQWLSASLRPKRKLVFQEILLLLLRLLLIAALAFFFAKPVAQLSIAPAHWVIVVPGADIRAAKNLPSKTASEWHWLAPGFPAFDDNVPSSPLEFSSLLRELDARLPAGTSLTVLVPEKLTGLDGARISLSRTVDWQRVSGEMPAAIAKTNAPIRLAIRYRAAQADSVHYFQAAQLAWQAEQKRSEKISIDIANTTVPLLQSPTALIWLSAGELPTAIRQWIADGGIAIVTKDSVVPELDSGIAVWRNEQGKTLVTVAAMDKGRVLQWQQVLRPETMPELLDAAFPDHLSALLQPSILAPTQSLAKYQTPLVGTKALPDAPQSLQSWLTLLIALLFLMERWLANSARRWNAT